MTKNLKTCRNELQDLAYIVYRLLDGDDVYEQAFEKLSRYGFVDENNEWIYDEDE